MNVVVQDWGFLLDAAGGLLIGGALAESLAHEHGTPVHLIDEGGLRARARQKMNRWWTYQRERFPLHQHGPLIIAFSFSAVSYSSLARGASGLPAWSSVAVAFITSLVFFLQLRIADEQKDADEDARYRPYRPVPRGLVRLRELAWIGVAGAALQLAFAFWLKLPLALWLALVWIYFALMSKEFFARDWLKARPFTYMWSHMFIMPLIDFYATATDWAVTRGRPPDGLWWFLIVSFFNGMVIEIGRKLRAPGDEEHGVQTYTVVWGRQKAIGAWLAAMVLTLGCAVIAARRIAFIWPVTLALGAMLLLAAWSGARFLREPVTRRAKWLETVSGLWTLLLYVVLGPVPRLLL
jgi:4-hydroxybenzoate polyprenyltransferase